MTKSLDQKLTAIRANPSGSKDFILADAKDADMGMGLAATGKDPVTGKTRSLNDYRDQMRQIVKQGLVDIMLMSASTSEILSTRERLFEGSAVTPAIRANDTTDIYSMVGGAYQASPSCPFRSAILDSGTVGTDLGLYSITPNNDIDADVRTLETYKQFRIEAGSAKFRHFLEVFDPNVPGAVAPEHVGRFINDFIARTLAGVTGAYRPLFLKMPYHGPRSLEELVNYDPNLVVGILGGSSGTTHDAFALLEDSRKHGARAALFGRKTNHSEHQLTFVTHLHAIANGKLTAAEAVKSYHSELEKLKLKPYRTLKDDLERTQSFVAN